MDDKDALILQSPCQGYQSSDDARGPFYEHGLSLIKAQISNYNHYNVWDEITFTFPNFNGETVEVWELISNIVPHCTGRVITYPCWD